MTVVIMLLRFTKEIYILPLLLALLLMLLYFALSLLLMFGTRLPLLRLMPMCSFHSAEMVLPLHLIISSPWLLVTVEQHLLLPLMIILVVLLLSYSLR